MAIKMGSADVHVVSREMVKPSHETDPSNLKSVKFSLLDQIQPPVYLPVLFVYEADAAGGFSGTMDPATICRNLKESLSKTLSVYPPLAGRADHQNFCIDCSDEGAEFVEARVHARLSDVLKEPNANELQKHLPLGRINYVGEGPLLAAQVNIFDCGGVSVGVCLPHKVADTTTLIEFVREWSSVCRDGKPPRASLHDFDSAARFLPPRDLSAWNLCHSVLIEKEPASSSTKSFVFTKDKLRALKKIATDQTSSVNPNSDIIVDNPSRVELVSAFIWNEFIDNNWDANKSFGAAEAVNIRRRACKSYELENTFGNRYVFPAAIFTPAAESKRLPQLQEQVSKLRKIIRGVNDEYTRKMGDEDEYLKYYSQMYTAMEMGKLEPVIISSWCGFPVYEVDFGWGKPAWVGTTFHTVIINSNFLLDTKCGEGVEAFVNLKGHNMEAFEAHFNQL